MMNTPVVHVDTPAIDMQLNEPFFVLHPVDVHEIDVQMNERFFAFHLPDDTWLPEDLIYSDGIVYRCVPSSLPLVPLWLWEE